MTVRFQSEAQMRAALGGKAPKKSSKYRSVPTVIDGIRFDSKREANRYVELKSLRSSGAVRWFLRQTPFHLPGGTKLVVDFLVVWKDGAITVEDAKGVQTQAFRVKRREVEHHYPIKVELK